MADFMFREYSSAQQGRWISPDPAGLAAASMTNPQTWNRYAYVGNSPLDTIDLLGLGPCNPDGFCDTDLPNDSGGTFLGLTTLSALNIPTYAPGLEPVYSPETGLLMGCRLVPGIQLSSWLVLQSGRRGSDTAQWWKDFAKSFVVDFSLSGRNGKTLCTVAAINHIRDELNPLADNSENVAESYIDKSEEAVKFGYAVRATTYAVGRGLTVPLKSRIYQGILARGVGVAGFVGERVVPVAAAAFAYKDIITGGVETIKEANAGECAGIFE